MGDRASMNAEGGGMRRLFKWLVIWWILAVLFGLLLQRGAALELELVRDGSEDGWERWKYAWDEA